MRILHLGKYSDLGASSRYRSYQYFPYLREQGFSIESFSLFDERYLQDRYYGKIKLTDIIASFWRRMSIIKRKGSIDLIWIEKEIFPYIPPVFEGMLIDRNIPFVVDYDDATFHTYDRHRLRIVQKIDGNKIGRLMRRSSLVIAGNRYIESYAIKWGARRVEVIPTVVDLERYDALPSAKMFPDKIVFGWIGTPVTAKYLKSVIRIFDEYKDSAVQFVAIGSGTLDFAPSSVLVRPWSMESEIGELKSLDVGIMPLVDSEWERGKCGLKLLQYMSCGLPVIASPVGVNVEIVEDDINGFLCRTESEWRDAVMKLSTDAMLRARLGLAGRQKVERTYDLKVTQPILAQLLRDAAGADRDAGFGR